MAAGGDELVWRAVSDTARQFGGDNLGVAFEEQNGQRTGDAPNPRLDDKLTPRASAGMVTASAGSGLLVHSDTKNCGR